MSISLEKRTEVAQTSMVNLMKEAADAGLDVDNISAACVLVMDYSGSMDHRYRNGEVQDLAERTLSLALAGLDDDGDIQVYFFHHGVFPAEEVNKENYSGFVDAWARNNSMGGTSYAPVIKEIAESVTGSTQSKGLFRKRQAATNNGPTAMPTLVFFVTDGEPSDKAETKKLLQDYSGLPIFWQFLGVGYSPAFLEELDNMGGRVVDNVALTSMEDTSTVEDATWFKEMLSEFITSWIPEARKAGIIT